VTAPLPNPTASCERFSSIAKAEICGDQRQVESYASAVSSPGTASSRCVCSRSRGTWELLSSSLSDPAPKLLGSVHLINPRRS